MPCAWHFIDASISLSSLPCELDIFTFVLVKRKPRFRELPGFPMVLQLVVVVIEKFVEMVEVVVSLCMCSEFYLLISLNCPTSKQGLTPILQFQNLRMFQ